jgi:microcin C transport system substrate-binding protein
MAQADTRVKAGDLAGAFGGAWIISALVFLTLALFPLLVRAETIKAHGISTFGPLKYAADFPHLEYVNPDAPQGGEMSIWGFGSFDTMNPYTVKGRAGGLSTVFYEKLLTETADEIGATYGLLAESLEYPEDRSEVIFNLRPEARFADGTPLTAEDVKFTVELFREKGLNSFRTQLKRKLESIEILGPHRIRFVFKKGIPTRDLPAEMGSLPVFSKAFYEANNQDLEQPSMLPMMGSGPYILDRVDEGKTLVYRKNPDYWGQGLPINIGRNNFETIRVEYFGDYGAAFEGFKGGIYHFRNEASSKIWATGYDFPAMTNGHVVKAELPHGEKGPNQSFIFNLRREKFSDPRVREAIGLMFNFEWSNETLFYGLYQRDSSFWANTDLAASGLPSAAELALLEPLADQLPEGVLTQEPFSYPDGSKRQLDRGALRRASALLEEAGWTVGDDGLRRNAAGEVLSLEILDDSPTFDRVLKPYVENLRALGIDARHERVDNAQMTRRERPPEYDFDMISGFLTTGYEPGSELRQYFGAETANNSAFNKMGLASPVVDALIEHVVAAETQEDMKTAVRALDRVLRALKFSVPEWFKGAHTVAYYDMYGHPDPLPPYALGHLDFWWYDAAKAEKLRDAGVLK